MTITVGGALIDGERRSAHDVDPRTMRYHGMWRPHVDPLHEAHVENLSRPAGQRWAVFICTCGTHIHCVDNGSHWRSGCFDIPQYATIPKEGAR
jgi:hypothetical protein